MAAPRKTDTLGGRTRRYARVGRTVGGLAARVAGHRYLGLDLDRDRHAEQLRAALGDLKGPLMKVAQIMSTIPDALPDEYSRELAELQADAPSMGWLFVRRRMASELGPDWQSRFAGFERQAAAAASLGQVHRAASPDGRPLACKLQYPDMASAVEADLKQLRVAFAVYSRYDRAVDTREVHREISDRLREELDYDLERRHMELYRLLLRDCEDVHIPEPVADLSTGRLLTMTWLEGTRLLEWTEADQEVRNRVARNMFEAWYRPFYFAGVIHGDPHLGNYSVRADGAINLLDFGCIRIFRPRFVQGVIDLYRALETDDRDLAVHAYETWGFADLTNEILDTLNLWATFVYGPLLDDRERSIQEGSGTAYGATVASKVHSELRRLGGVTVPREFVLMDRAAIGLGSVFLRLQAKINWHDLFQSLIAGFSSEAMQMHQEEALRQAGIGMPE